MRVVIVILILLTLYLQFSLRFTRGGSGDVDKLKASVAEQKAEIARLKERNRSLSAEVIDLKQGLEAIEERARSEMGMIKDGEVFFRITDPDHALERVAPPVGPTAPSVPPAQMVDRFAEGEAPALGAAGSESSPPPIPPAGPVPRPGAPPPVPTP